MVVMEAKPRLFGTDGIRGIAGEYPLDRTLVWRIGAALGEVLSAEATEPARVAMGRDTRESGAWLADSMTAGLIASGAEVSDVGVITTPGVAFLTRHHGFAAGVVISASHNPYRDNGIKVLSPAGIKLPESIELRIEEALDRIAAAPPHASSIDRRVEPASQLADNYLDFLEGSAGRLTNLSGHRLVMDCANGAAFRLGPALMERLGIKAYLLNATPNGRNVNRACGSLHPAVVSVATKDLGAELGVAFDGDADRAIFATASGRVADGDHVLFAVSRFLEERGELKGRGVVGTLMTNFALEQALERRGLALKRTPVGDRYVLEEMQRARINLGGEPSGHIIFSDLSLAGDGLLTLLEVLRIMGETGRSLDELVESYEPLPQLILNVRVRSKPALESVPPVAEAMAHCRRDIDGNGRLVVRYSGTEPLARVMVEAENASVVRRHAEAIAGAIENSIGAGPGRDGASARSEVAVGED
ncbi:MAG TPA: phosphoglucosamine mutase [Terriglobia bacterium]|nr:phosphoglucosamine mutase [Terriglobia bacterium]